MTPNTSFTCPRCDHRLHSHQPIPMGKHLRCPHCGTSFPTEPANPGNDAPRAGRALLLAWGIFGSAIVLLGAGIGLAVYVNNKHQQQVFAANTPPEGTPLADQGQPPADPSPPASVDAPLPRPPAPRADPLVNPPPEKEPPLPVPPLSKPAPPPEPKEPAAAPQPDRTEAPQVQWLSAPAQRKVDRAVDRGVEFLRRQQHFDGAWGHQTAALAKRHTPGITALSALTLLECGVAAKDPQVQLAAEALREQMPNLTATYSISLAMLFFDRLGDKQDIPRIRTLALRLIAGQKSSGGWDYFCPKLKDDEELGLLTRLYQDRPTSSRDLFLTAETKRPGLDLTTTKPSKPDLHSDLYRPKPSTNPPLDLFVAVDPKARGASSGEQAAPKPAPLPDKAAPPPPRTDKPLSAKAGEKAAPDAPAAGIPRDRRRLSERALAAASRLPESLRRTPALHSASVLRGRFDDLHPRTDNSNTQFAVLGLLVAEKADVPMERTLALIDWRFHQMATAEGGWDYQTNKHTKETMTCSGLLGLAIKYGLLLPNAQNRGRHVRIRDPFIRRALFVLSRMLDSYYLRFLDGQSKLEHLDLYCLWSVERVAVLYNLRKIGNLDWYPLGVRLLLPLQREDGSWSPSAITGRGLDEPAVGTSFALLFFKRSNLSRSLTERLNADEK